MALLVPPAPRTRARAARSTSSDRRTGRRLLTAFVLARTSLLVLTGRTSVDAACGGHDRHRVEHGFEMGRRLDVVLAGSTDAVTGHRCLLVVGRDHDLAALIAGREAVTVDADTASTLTDDGPLQQQRMPSLCPVGQQERTVAQGAVDRSGAPGRQASRTVLPQEESAAVRDHIGWLDSPLQVEEGRLLGVRRAGPTPATPTMSSTLAVAGLIGLLGVCGAAAFIVHSVTGPVRRAVRVLQAPEKRRLGHRLRPTALHEIQNTSRAAGTAGDDPLEAARAIGAPSAEEFPTPAGGVSTEEAAMPAEAVTVASTPAASSVPATRYAAARSRALGPTTALWHAVELDRLVGAVGGACETTVCGSLVRVSTEQRWPVPARDVCPACSTLAH